MRHSTDSLLVRLVAQATYLWTVLYTWRLSEEVRAARRAEIESDLWEQEAFSSITGEPAVQTAASIMTRFLLGSLDDMTWSLEARAVARSDRGSEATNRQPVLVRIATAGAYTVAGVIVFVCAGSLTIAVATANFWYGLFAVLMVALTIAIIQGLRLSPERPRLGLSLVSGASLLLAGSWFWWIFFTLPIALGLIAASYLRGRQAQRIQTVS